VGCKVPGVASQSPRDTSSWRSSTTPADWPACAAVVPCPARRKRGDHGLFAAGKDLHRVAHLHAALGDAAPQHARLFAHAFAGAGHVLHRQAEAASVCSCARGQAFEQLQQARALVPGCASGVVTLSPRSADTGTMPATADAGLLRRRRAGAAHRGKGLAGLGHGVELVHGKHDAGHPQQMGQQAVAARLRQQATSGWLSVQLGDVHQHHGGVAAGRSGDHVAGVLLVARGVGDDELARRRGEVAVGHVDGDALFALGLQAVGEQAQVDGLRRRRARAGGPADRPGWRGCRTAGGR
jgi:hypothetical protein